MRQAKLLITTLRLLGCPACCLQEMSLSQAAHQKHHFSVNYGIIFQMTARLLFLSMLFPTTGTSLSAHRGQRKSTSKCQLPFSYVHVWNNFRIQQHSSQDSHILLPSRTIQALPPSANVPHGRCNTVLVSDTDGSGEHTSLSGTDGESSTHLSSFVINIVFCPRSPQSRPSQAHLLPYYPK